MKYSLSTRGGSRKKWIQTVLSDPGWTYSNHIPPWCGPCLPLPLTLCQLIRSHPTHRRVLQTISLGPALALKHATPSLWNVLFPLLGIARSAHSDSSLFYFLWGAFSAALSTPARPIPTPHTFWYLFCLVHHPLQDFLFPLVSLLY